MPFTIHRLIILHVTSQKPCGNVLLLWVHDENLGSVRFFTVYLTSTCTMRISPWTEVQLKANDHYVGGNTYHLKEDNT